MSESGRELHQVGVGDIRIGDPGPVAGHYGDVRDVLLELPNTGHGYMTMDLFPVRHKIISELVPRPTSVFEFGALYGYFLVTACDAAPEIDRIGWIDPEEHTTGSNELCQQNIYAYYRQHRLAIDPSVVWCGETTQRCREFGTADLVQVDGAHTYTDCFTDLMWALELAPRVIFVDDYKAIAEVQLATDHFAKLWELDVEYHETVNGLAVLRR